LFLGMFMLRTNTLNENNSVRSDDFNEKSRRVRQANVKKKKITQNNVVRFVKRKGEKSTKGSVSLVQDDV
jgi:hypothetical protein